MYTAVSHDIGVTVRARFEAAHSDARAGRYLFSYSVTIVNHGRDTVQLLSRHWIIRDGLAGMREVVGPGVVGETPTLAAGESFSYSSACDLRSGLGSMEGDYMMQRVGGETPFQVTIPRFFLRWPPLAN